MPKTCSAGDAVVDINLRKYQEQSGEMKMYVKTNM